MSFVVPQIKPTAAEITGAAQARIDGKTKPPGSLGLLESTALRMCQIQNRLKPAIERKESLVFAADHGVTAAGVSAFPKEVTPQMALNMAGGGAAINVFCRLGGIGTTIIDVGVDFDFPEEAGIADRKIGRGTRDFSQEAAMSREEAQASLRAGVDAFEALKEHGPVSLVGLGEMGIGNTTSASAIICVLTGISPEEAAGRGTGVDDAGLKRKIEVLTKSLALHRPSPLDPVGVLAMVGGFEIGAMAGAALAAAAAGTAVVLDGLISTAAGLLAATIEPKLKGYLFSGHRSVEKGQAAALQALELEPLIDLNLRLGEGTGAALAMHHIEAACAFLNEMASFESAGVSGKN